MRRLLVLLVVALVAVAAPARAAAPLQYLLVSGGDPAVPRALVVYLHGCSQTAADAAIGTQWDDLARREGIVVVFPQQPPEANGARCWNWFLPEHQARGGGEPAAIVAVVEDVMARHAIDPSRVYVAGASAGADMATILGATHPDVFAAIAPFAGCAYRTCTDVDGSAAKAAMGEHARPVPALIVQGTADPLNDPALGATAVRQWIWTNGVPATPTSTEDHGDPTAVAPGSGDLCIRNGQFPCAAGVLGWSAYPYTVHHHADASGCSLVDAWYVHGLSHDYPGGDPDGTFTDPAGPDATAAAWAFFQQHRLNAPCSGS